MASAGHKNGKPLLTIEVPRSSSRQSHNSGSSSPKLLSPRDKKNKIVFPLSPAMGTELERLKQTYTPVAKVTKPPPEERPLVRSFSQNAQNRHAANTKFRSLGGKVTNLLRVRKAFATTKKDEDDIITSNKHLPKEPRFSSLLSPAAQYAMMKGYEDAVYENLCKHYPASKLFLKRSRTPPMRAKIDIGDLGKLTEPSIPEEKTKESNSNLKTESNSEKDTDNNIARQRRRIVRLAEMTQSEPNTSITPLDSKTALENRRNTLTRTKSMPVVPLPREKRIILTHRLQSAMDILDTVRCNTGQNSISPRINTYPRQIQPVSDFNNWSSIWSSEFKISRAGKTK